MAEANEQRESRDHLALGRLLGKSRAESQLEAVDRIIAQDVPVARKIELIQELDARVASTGAALSGAEPGGRVRPLQVTYAVLHDLTRVHIPAPSLLGYWLRESGLMRAFGERCGALEVAHFLPRPRLSIAVVRARIRELAMLATELLATCAAVLQDGWRYLDRYEYNLVVVLHRLLDKLRTLNLQGVDSRDRNLVERFQSVETLITFFRSRPEYLEALRAGLAEAAEHQGVPAPQLDALAASLPTLLGGGVGKPTLEEMLLAANMLRSRRYLTFADLQPERLGDLVYRSRYACGDDVQEQINEAIRGARDRLAELSGEQKAIEEIRLMVPFAKGALELDVLEAFYAREAERPLQEDADMVVHVPRLTKAFDRLFFSLFNERVGLSDGRSVRLPVDTRACRLHWRASDRWWSGGSRKRKTRSSCPGNASSRYLLLRSSHRPAS